MARKYSHWPINIPLFAWTRSSLSSFNMNETSEYTSLSIMAFIFSRQDDLLGSSTRTAEESLPQSILTTYSPMRFCTTDGINPPLPFPIRPHVYKTPPFVIAILWEEPQATWIIKFPSRGSLITFGVSCNVPALLPCPSWPSMLQSDPLRMQQYHNMLSNQPIYTLLDSVDISHHHDQVSHFLPFST